MLHLILLIFGIVYAVRRPKLKALEPAQFPHVPVDQFHEWKRLELQSIAIFLWATWGLLALSIPVQVAVASAVPDGAMATQLLFGVVFFALVIFSAIRGSKAAKIKKQFGIGMPVAAVDGMPHTTDSHPRPTADVGGASAKQVGTGHAAEPSPHLYRFPCPSCGKALEVSLEYVGTSGRCNQCGSRITVPSSIITSPPTAAEHECPPPMAGVPDHGTPPSHVGAEADWGELVEYLRSGMSADILSIGDAGVFENVTQYYQTIVNDPDHPKLTFYLLTASDPAAPAQVLVVSTGEKSEHDRAWNFDHMPLLNRVHPGFTWEHLYGTSSVNCVSNHSKPGCGLASHAPFDRLAQVIADRHYAVKCVLRPVAGGATKPKGPRWNVQIFGDEAVRPDLACQVCGDNRVAFGLYGSHLICRRCGAIYCRRNCMASIHGQCPRCGETDKVDGVSESDAPVQSPSLRVATCPIGLEAATAELIQLVGADNSGFMNKVRIREIGEQLHREGGMELMREAFYLVRKDGIYFSEDIWDGIGSWMC